MLIVAVLFFLLSGRAAFAFPLRDEVSVTFKVTVSVLQNGKAYTGSKVWMMLAWQDHVLLDNYGMHWKIFGEAIPIQLPSGGRMYFLKRSPRETTTETFGDFPASCLQDSIAVDGPKALVSFVSPCDIDIVDPLIVVAGNTADSVKRLPISITKNHECLELCLESVVIERSSDPVSKGIVEDLPWLGISKAGLARIGEEYQRTGTQVLNKDNLTYFKQDFIVE